MSAHAACSPSSASMWLACPASVTLTRDVTRPSSKYAREGTAAHAVAEMTLNGRYFPARQDHRRGRRVHRSPGMCRALNPYVTHVQSLRALPGAAVVLEKRLVVPTPTAWSGARSTAAFAPSTTFTSSISNSARALPSDPTGPQLKFYALALRGASWR